MVPRIESDEVGFNLALANVLPEKLVDKQLLVEHLLNVMNNKIAAGLNDNGNNNHGNVKTGVRYMEALKLPKNEPIYDVHELLNVVGNNIGRRNDTQNACVETATFILNKFNKGKFGK